MSRRASIGAQWIQQVSLVADDEEKPPVEAVKIQKKPQRGFETRDRRSLGGRPAGAIGHLASYTRQLTREGKACIDELWKIATTARRDSDRIRALEVLMDRGFGKTVDVQVLATITGTEAASEFNALSNSVLEVLSRAGLATAPAASADVVDAEVIEPTEG